MRSHISLLILVLTAITASTCPGMDTSVRIAPPTDANAGGGRFPYTAQITGDDVFVRSGPGTHYYGCGQLDKGDRVTVVDEKLGWSRIVPPIGSFSWIPMRYISVSIDDPSIATITGDRVRVYAGSESVEPIRSETLQLKLNRMDTVKLLGVEKDDYCKIEPPKGAYLWVSSNYTKPVDSAIIPAPDSDDEMAATDANEAPVDANDAAVGSAEEPEESIEAKMLEKYEEIEAKIDAEKAKPVQLQDYADLKKQLGEIAATEGAGKAAKYANFALERIKRLEMVIKINKELGRQTADTEEALARIESVKEARLEQFVDKGKFAAIGQLTTSNIYGPEASLMHYRIVDPTGKTICYALPSGSATDRDIDLYMDKKVGLIGKIVPHPQTGGALVKFTGLEIVD